MVSQKGVSRVVWERRRIGVTNGEQVDFIPFLNISRSLGDFWSYCPRSGEFVVSPRPDVYVHSLNAKVQKFIVIVSDGLWNVMSPKQVVEFIWDYEHAHEDTPHLDVVRAVINEALSRWNSRHHLADNIAVLIAFLSEGDYCSPSVACNKLSQVDRQQQQANVVHRTRGGSTSYYKETFADGTTVEGHTKIRLWHRKQHHNSYSKVKTTSSSVGGAGSSTNGADTTEGLRRSPLKRERPEETNADECSSKRLKVDLPDFGCDCNSDKMDTEDSSPPV